MVRLIFSIVLFIILAVFVALNAQYTTTINFFSYVIEEVSVAAVVTITMAVGVLYSFMLYVSNYLAKARAERLKEQKLKNKERANELAAKEKAIEQAPAETAGNKPPAARTPAAGGASGDSPEKKKTGLFGKRKKRRSEEPRKRRAAEAATETVYDENDQ